VSTSAASAVVAAVDIRPVPVNLEDKNLAVNDLEKSPPASTTNGAEYLGAEAFLNAGSNTLVPVVGVFIGPRRMAM
jgi:hypothetical protein